MSNEKMQEEFEAWWCSTPILSESKRTLAEKAWQASREALVITLPSTECFGEYSEEAARIMRDSCADAIEEQGINFEVSE